MINPVKDRVFVKEQDQPTYDGSRLFRPNTRPPIVKATVIARGPGRAAEGLSPGDLVLYPQFAGEEVEVDGQRYRVINAADILGRVVE